MLYDILVYRCLNGGQTPSILIECAAEVCSSLQAHIRKYQLRARVNLRNLSETLETWVLLDCEPRSVQSPLATLVRNGCVVACGPDPRLPELGVRLITTAGARAHLAASFGAVVLDNDAEYQRRRRRLGIGEGPVDFPMAESFPLECNLDYLDGGTHGPRAHSLQPPYRICGARDLVTRS